MEKIIFAKKIAKYCEDILSFNLFHKPKIMIPKILNDYYNDLLMNYFILAEINCQRMIFA